MTAPEFQTVLISAESAGSPLAEKAARTWPEARIETSENSELDERKFNLAPDPVAEGKRNLVLAPNKGRFVRKCPGTMGLVCCNYWVIDLAEGCVIDCSYCILQGYLTDRRVRLATNIDDLEKEIDEEIEGRDGPLRFGTGELSDSLMLEPNLGLAETLIDIFRRRPQATLELKTKTANVSSILELTPAPNVVIAWSLNTPQVIESEEKGSASLNDRLNAAMLVAQAGWQVAFHFDPLVIHEEWKVGYEKVVSRMFEAVTPGSVAWISLGAFRFHPSLKPVIRERFKDSKILDSQFVLCPDNKMRYVKPLRRELFETVKSYIDNKAPGVPVYLCMEGIETWRAVFGGGPDARGALGEVFG